VSSAALMVLNVEGMAGSAREGSTLRHNSLSSVVATVAGASSMLFCSQSKTWLALASTVMMLLGIIILLEVGIAGDGHELDITWPPQDDMVGSFQVNILKGERLGVVVVRISEGDRQINLHKRDGLLARDHSV
jgi:hypothetical protein